MRGDGQTEREGGDREGGTEEQKEEQRVRGRNGKGGREVRGRDGKGGREGKRDREEVRQVVEIYLMPLHRVTGAQHHFVW